MTRVSEPGRAVDRLALLADAAVRSAFGRELGLDIEYHASIGSTQDRARELGRAGSSALVVADHQTGGHGRGEKTWLSEPGASLLAAWVFRPAPAEPALFALLAGVAVARALAPFGVADRGLKWPNDLWLTGGKVAGCLAHGATDHLVIGIGVNVSGHELPADIAGIGVDPEIERVCRSAAFALRKAGARVDEIELDLSAAKPSFMAVRGEWYVNWTQTRMDRQDKFGANVAANVKSGLAMTMRELAEGERVRGEVWHSFRKFFEKYDHLVTPCTAVPPFPVDQNYPDTVAGKKMATYADWFAPTFVLSVTGLPVGAVPCGHDANGMPIGLQVVGRQFGEEEVLALARGVEIVTAR